MASASLQEKKQVRWRNVAHISCCFDLQAGGVVFMTIFGGCNNDGPRPLHSLSGVRGGRCGELSSIFLMIPAGYSLVFRLCGSRTAHPTTSRPEHRGTCASSRGFAHTQKRKRYGVG
ncbi:hypothetical protein BGZ61DRAFT_158295 [Ilyonectria robusta]|uniref:uncharacterized protein n=1 Tax=Ilyonectria robusta TaxID=1079257 RepID=UPI001E8D9FF5|nr:uncharacterized protein BGZ61DRAFT_158295 [Ilyonectria robusta]KAH8733373.1 hypothetical protein BGZ61DRAFT_158295 [Ilyonectria robusta]